MTLMLWRSLQAVRAGAQERQGEQRALRKNHWMKGHRSHRAVCMDVPKNSVRVSFLRFARHSTYHKRWYKGCSCHEICIPTGLLWASENSSGKSHRYRSATWEVAVKLYPEFRGRKNLPDKVLVCFRSHQRQSALMRKYRMRLFFRFYCIFLRFWPFFKVDIVFCHLAHVNVITHSFRYPFFFQRPLLFSFESSPWSFISLSSTASYRASFFL